MEGDRMVVGEDGDHIKKYPAIGRGTLSLIALVAGSMILMFPNLLL